MYSNIIYGKNIARKSMNEVFDDFATINSELFQNYVNNLSIEPLTVEYSSILEDVRKGEDKQTLLLKNYNGVMVHYFDVISDLRASVSFINESLNAYFKYIQNKSKVNYCSFKADRNFKEFVESKFTGVVKDLILAHNTPSQTKLYNSLIKA